MTPPDFELTPEPIRFPEDLELAQAALAGDPEAVQRVKDLLDDSSLTHFLIQRGASSSEAAELLGDLWGDLFGGKKASGEPHRILGRYNGGCPLKSYLWQVAFRRLIDLKRRQRPTVSVERGSGPEEQGLELPGITEAGSEDVIVDLLREAVVRALSDVDQERLVLLRLHYSYHVPQEKIARMWGWSAAKVSRALSGLRAELLKSILKNIREADPWLEIEWNDVIGLCQETLDLFDY